MTRHLATLLLAMLAAGCATKPPGVPVSPPERPEFNGPQALLTDTVKPQGKTRWDFFVAEQVDGVATDDSIRATQNASRGRGASMAPVLRDRALYAGKATHIAVRARTQYAAPILELNGPVYQVTGVIEFTPQAGQKYAVRGELGPTYSAVWIEDVTTGAVMGKKREVRGPAQPGMLDR